MNLGRKCSCMKKVSETDFSKIAEMDQWSKIRILEYLSGRRNSKDLSESEAVWATKILSERLSNPGFIPNELDPRTWSNAKTETENAKKDK